MQTNMINQTNKPWAQSLKLHRFQWEAAHSAQAGSHVFRTQQIKLFREAQDQQ